VAGQKVQQALAQKGQQTHVGQQLENVENGQHWGRHEDVAVTLTSLAYCDLTFVICGALI
jgi:hypothetical protein